MKFLCLLGLFNRYDAFANSNGHYGNGEYYFVRTGKKKKELAIC